MTRRRSPAAAPYAAFALVLVAACGRGSEPAAAARPALAVEVSPSPPRVGAATLAFHLTGPGGEPVRGATLRVEATMSHAGMTPEFADGAEVAPGRYEARLEFTMGGDWILLVDATTAEGVRHHWQEDLPNVASEGER